MIAHASGLPVTLTIILIAALLVGALIASSKENQ